MLHYASVESNAVTTVRICTASLQTFVIESSFT